MNVLNLRMWWRQSDDWTIEDRGLHGTSHHRVREQSCNAVVAVGGVGVTEVFLESLPVHTVVCFEESEVREQPCEVTCQQIMFKMRGWKEAHSSSLFRSGVPVKHHL